MKYYTTIFWICLSLDILLALITLFSLITKSLAVPLKTGLYFFLLLVLIVGFFGMHLKDSGYSGWAAILASIPVLLTIAAVIVVYIALKDGMKRLF